MIRILLATAISVAFVSIDVRAHGDAKSEKRAAKPISAEEQEFGRQGDPRNVLRTVTINMSDRMRFSPSAIDLKQGDTVRFVVKNAGNVPHEMVLGTMAELKRHAELMKKHPQMEHEEPHMAHVAPGKSQTIVWQFTRPGEFHYGCLMPGHFEAGMVGRITVDAKGERR